MKGRRSENCNRTWIKIVRSFSIVVILFTSCTDARKSRLLSQDVSHLKSPNIKHLTILEVAKNLNMVMDVSLKDSSNPEPYVSSPFTLPPYDALAPVPFPDNNNPPYCVYPPPQSPSTTILSPSEPSPTPPSPSSSSPDIPLLSPPPGPGETVPGPSGSFPSPPDYEPSPPSGTVPGPPDYVPSPIIFPPSPPSGTVPGGPPDYVPSPINFAPSPPSDTFPGPPDYVPSPIGFVPSPPVFQPPVVFPPPTVPPSRGGGTGGGSGGWCVAKPSVPDPILQEAMNYACGSGADCDPLQPNGSCYQPNSLLAHASYAFNSYWQRTKAAGGTCDFGGTAILVTVDPSSSGCKFMG